MINVILILAIISTMVFNQVRGRDCTLECERGTCEIGQADFSVFNKYNTAHNLPFANITHVDMMYCKCPEGYTGVTCEIKYDSCNSNAHACFHGAKCVQLTSAIGTIQYRCDCSVTDDANVVYAGLYCEHAATSYCEYGTSVSKKAFCTNDGTCVTTIAIGQAHQGCHCLQGYSGQHCEYSIEHLSKQIEPNNINNKNIENESTTTAGPNELGATIFFSFDMVLCTIILIWIFIVIRKIKKRDEDPFFTSRRDRTIQHATTQVNFDNDLQLEQDKEISKENEII